MHTIRDEDVAGFRGANAVKNVDAGPVLPALQYGAWQRFAGRDANPNGAEISRLPGGGRGSQEIGKAGRDGEVESGAEATGDIEDHPRQGWFSNEYACRARGEREIEV